MSKQTTNREAKRNEEEIGKLPGKKNSAQISAYKKVIQTNGPTLEGQRPKGRKNSTLKPGERTSNTVTLKQ